MQNITIYTHAAKAGNTNRSCYLLITDNRTRMEQKRVPGTDANRVLLQTAIHILQSLSKKKGHHIKFFSPSQYLIRGMTARLPVWKQRGWRDRSGRLPGNHDLWMQLDQLTQEQCISWLYPQSPEEQRQMDKVTDQVYAAPLTKQQRTGYLDEHSFGLLRQHVQRCETCGSPSNFEMWETDSPTFCSPECRAGSAE